MLMMRSRRSSPSLLESVLTQARSGQHQWSGDSQKKSQHKQLPVFLPHVSKSQASVTFTLKTDGETTLMKCAVKFFGGLASQEDDRGQPEHRVVSARRTLTRASGLQSHRIRHCEVQHVSFYTCSQKGCDIPITFDDVWWGWPRRVVCTHSR